MVVGSGALDMRRAIIYCTVFELLGAAFMGGHVSETIRTDIIDPVLLTERRDVVLIGMTCACFAAALWLYLSAVFGLPVSITHTVVGSFVGFAIFSTGSFQFVQFLGVVKILISWLFSPTAACVLTAGIFYLLRKYILEVKDRSFQRTVKSVPYCLGFSLLINLMFIVIEQTPLFSVTIAKFIPIRAQYFIILTTIFFVCCFFSFLKLPRLAAEAKGRSSFVWLTALSRVGNSRDSAPSSPATYGTLAAGKVGSPTGLDVADDWELDNTVPPMAFGGLAVTPFNPRAEFLFTLLQVVAGSVSSFVHGAVAGANATAAFVIFYDTFAASKLNAGQIHSGWAVLPAMAGMAIGILTLGERLMKTVGAELVALTPARGWCIQIGATLVTMVFTGIGIPLSLSQAQVGAAIGCGLLDAQWRGVSWRVVSKIACGWALTLVVASVTTGVLMWLLAFFYCV